jgi:biotin carboxyl carrier protein
MNKKYTITSGSGNSNSVTISDEITIAGSLADITLISEKEQIFSIKIGDKTFKSEVLKVDYQTKSFELLINFNKYKLSAADDFDLLLKQMGFGLSSGLKIKEMKAPMPGMVLNVLVKEGDVVEKGDTLILLEAMKMENSIKALANLVVKKVSVEKGKAVEKNQVLIIFE